MDSRRISETPWESTRVPKEGETLSKHGLARNAGPDYSIDHETGCWEWQKFKLRGYGKTSWRGQSAHAHRVYFELAFGAIPAGHDVHHRCENPGCVNPGHLELKTRRQHLADHKQEKSPLSWDDVRDIRRRAEEGAVALAREYGLTHNYIGQIILNRYWVDPGYEPEVLDRECARPGCDRRFTPHSAMSRYCGKPCRALHNSRVSTGYYERRGIAA